MSGYAFALVLSLGLLVVLVHLLRTRRVREKYTAIWIVVAVAICTLGAFPRVVFWLAHVVGVKTPVNLLFALAALVLLIVCLQLSAEVSSLEEKSRTLAEEVAILDLRLSELAATLGEDAVDEDPQHG